LKKLICFGDSITVGEGLSDEALGLIPRLRQVFGTWEIINAGAGGNNTRDALARINEDVLRHNPDIVTVFFGANDAATHKMIDIMEFEGNLEAIISKTGAEKTILISPAPVDEGKPRNRTNEIMGKYTASAAKVAACSNCGLIDLFWEMIVRPDYKNMLSDGLHFSAGGYEFLSGLIIEKLKLGGKYGHK